MTLVPYKRQFAAFGDDFFKDFFSDRVIAPRVMKTDIKETDKAYVVEAEMPGVKKEDVALICREGVLTISVKSSEEKTEEKDNYVRKERVSGEMSRSFALKDINEEDISAKLDDGVLSVTLPKKAAEEERKIEIE